MLNVYQIYAKNGFKTSFKVRRHTWSGTVATVKSIGGRKSGRLKGVAPYWGNPKVKADVSGTWEEKNVILSGCGTYQWELVD